MTSVAVCIPTYRRPAFLADLLQSLAAMDTTGLDVRVIVVDNDAAESAAPVVQRFAACLPAVTYVVEPAKGVASARNRLVAMALTIDAEYVAFVDDDEWVEAGWLAALVRTARNFGADAVAGPVLPEYDKGVPGWVVRGKFFHRRRYRTGHPVRIDATSNLLLARSSLDGLDGPFDRRFDRIGGSDHHLLERLARRGARMVWSDEAVVHEQIPLSRANAGWLLRRAFRGGATFSAIAADLEPTPTGRANRAARALTRLGIGALLLPLGLVRGRAATVHAVCHAARGLGGLLGTIGVSYREYDRLHGR